MRLHCLGTVGYHPNVSRHTSCYFLPRSGLVLDAGTGMFRLPELIETDTLDILLSHAHLDHIVGLTFLLDVLDRRPVAELRIWGESAKLEAVQRHLFSELLFPAQLDARWMPIDGRDEFQLGEVTVSWRHQDHPGGSVAYRLTWSGPKRLVYATDTSGDTSDEFARWAADTNLLMHECYFRDGDATWAQETGHCWPGRVADIAAAAQPEKLLLTHISPRERTHDPVDLESIRTTAGCDVLVAADGLVVDF